MLVVLRFYILRVVHNPSSQLHIYSQLFNVEHVTGIIHLIL